MNFFQILSDIEKVDPEVYDRLDSRRRVFKNMAGVGQKLTAAALPMFVGAVFNKAYAQTPSGIDVNTVLNLALKLEYLESFFYQQRTGITSQLSTVNATSLATIATDEANHVTFLRGVLGNNAITAPTLATFDFTAKGRFPTVLSNAAVYLAVAQALEDTGVRAYKGAAPLPSIIANKTVLTAALNIHSIEARHASRIRSIRRGGLTSTAPTNSVSGTVSGPTGQPKSWIVGNDGGGPVPGTTDAVYGAGNNTGAPTGVTFESEANTSQGGVALSSSSITSITFPSGSTAFSEAFDEGLDAVTVITIANLFSTTGTFFNP
jgi:hypothetical protein